MPALPSPSRPRELARAPDLRRLRILASVQAGLSYAAIGRDEGVSRERVRQIVAQAFDDDGVETKLDHARVQTARLEPALRLRRGRSAMANSARSTGSSRCSTGSTNTAPSRAREAITNRAGASGCSPSSTPWPSACCAQVRPPPARTGAMLRQATRMALTRPKALIGLKKRARRQAAGLTSLDAA